MIDWLDLNPYMQEKISWLTYERFLIDFFIVLLNYKNFYYKYFEDKDIIIKNIKNNDKDYIKKIDERFKKMDKKIDNLINYLNKKSKNKLLWSELINFLFNEITIEKNLLSCNNTEKKTIDSFIKDLGNFDFTLVIFILNFTIYSYNPFVMDLEHIFKYDIKWLKKYWIIPSIDFELMDDNVMDIIIYTEFIDIDFELENWYEDPNNSETYSISYQLDKLIKEQNNSFLIKNLFKLMEE